MHARIVAAVAGAWPLLLQQQQQGVAAQGIGNADTHPRLSTEKCTNTGGCVKQETAIVLDASFHELRQVNGTSSCGGYGIGSAAPPLSKELCPDPEVCARNCVFDAADYEGSGVFANGSSLTLNMYMERRGVLEPVSPRVYLLDKEGDNYEVLYIKNKEISFDVDVSKLVCGMNGALYLAEMNSTGARSALNPAGARYGTGYCDAQCPKLPFINGVANLDSKGACCNEMDLWEANAVASAFTAHVCSQPGVYACTGGECGSIGVCDKSGCAYNTWRMGNTTFYGPRSALTPPPSNNTAGAPGATPFTIDTTRPFTVTTQFLTTNNPSPINKDTLNEVRRLYVQDGVVIDNAAVADPAMPPGDSLRMSHCQAVGNTFENLGGLRTAGLALDRGMVLAFSIWNDGRQFMNWLNSGRAGPCDLREGNPAVIKERRPDTAVTFSNIRWGDIGSTYGRSQGTVSGAV
ncbi:glycoside hydrolase family 7 protein [Durotheca rogersii]|uniref:glycoside hydrolase family 7 protein n=1 Tax=Durotheca rogersii TaxID=419775 RepID=UPI002220B2DD|nr:glycoside hydrolase family 7 protein [Durotheca rogersii]KAI5867237.1 glycoside hydrolase family 7 protein [Durotheca rogersii]